MEDRYPNEWTAEQWNCVQEAVRDEARKVRVAASFLPHYGPLAPDAETVPKQRLCEPPPDGLESELPPGDECIGHDGADDQRGARLTVLDYETIRLTTIAVNVYIKTQQAAQPDLASALVMFRRAANVIARVEDSLIFNGQKNVGEGPPLGVTVPSVFEVRGGGKYKGLNDLMGRNFDGDLSRSIEIENWQTVDERGQKLVVAVNKGVARLENYGHVGPFALVLGNEFFVAAQTPEKNSLVLPSDRIKPMIEGPLLRTSTLPERDGLLISLAGEPIELVVASELAVRFLQVTPEPRYLFRVSERIALRIKEPEAIAKLYINGEASRAAQRPTKARR